VIYPTQKLSIVKLHLLNYASVACCISDCICLEATIEFGADITVLSKSSYYI